jgi:hypothetical protein
MKTLCLSFWLSVVALAAAAPNYSGTWVIEEPGGAVTRQTMTTTLVLNQIGNEVTGTISYPDDAGSASPTHGEILDGKVEGETLTFYVWTGLDRPMKAFYKGTLAGDEIRFVVTGGAPALGGFSGSAAGAGKGSPQPITAKRAK